MYHPIFLMQKYIISKKVAFIRDLAGHVVDQCGLFDEAILLMLVDNINDGIYNYARILCHYGSLVLEFMDAWAEGDGDRICTCWKLLLVHFHEGQRAKYALQALRLQFQLHQLHPSVAHQLNGEDLSSTKVVQV